MKIIALLSIECNFAASIALRSARRQTVRQTWQCEVISQPPGIVKQVRGLSSDCRASMRDSSHSIFSAASGATLSEPLLPSAKSASISISVEFIDLISGISCSATDGQR